MAAITISHTRQPGFVPAIQVNGQWVFAKQSEYEARIAELEAEDMTTSDAQGVAMAEVLTQANEAGQAAGA
jgi:hypothetical protein